MGPATLVTFELPSDVSLRMLYSRTSFFQRSVCGKVSHRHVRSGKTPCISIELTSLYSE